MKIKDIRAYDDNHRLVNMTHQDKEFAYYNDGERESFEVYHLDSSRDSGFRYSRCYKMHEGQTPPAKYNSFLKFMKDEFNKINWDAKYVEYKLSLAR